MPAPVWLDRGAYTPLVLDPESRRNGHPALSLVARLRDGIEIEGAEAELTQLASQMLEDYGPIDDDIEFVVDPASTWAAGADLKQSLWIFMGSAALLLLIGCMNSACAASLSSAGATPPAIPRAVALARNSRRVMLPSLSNCSSRFRSDIIISSFVLSSTARVPAVTFVGVFEPHSGWCRGPQLHDSGRWPGRLSFAPCRIQGTNETSKWLILRLRN